MTRWANQWMRPETLRLFPGAFLYLEDLHGKNRQNSSNILYFYAK